MRFDGTQFPIEISLSPIETEDGILVSSTISDISERKRADELKRQFERKEANEHFISLLAHELKAPIIGANHVLKALADNQMGDLNEKQTELLDQVIDGHTSTLAMIGDIVEVYQFEKDIENMVLTTLNMIELVNQCVVEAEKEARKRNIDIMVELPEAVPNFVGNKKSLRRVLENLLDNAIRFSKSNTSISVHLEVTDSNTIELSIQDSGPGIGALDRERLFHRFWQGVISNRYTPGTGQGLYYCKQIVDAHNGSIACDTELGKGSRFTVTLPLKPKEASVGQLRLV